MPIYEYQCAACGEEFSKLMKAGASAPSCPKCANDDVQKKVSQTSFQLKGGGWYVTDFRDGGGGPGAAAKPAKETSAATSDSKSDTSSSSTSDSGGKSESKSSTAASSAD